MSWCCGQCQQNFEEVSAWKRCRRTGELALYSDGLLPSSIPPCAGARAVLVLVAEVTVVVTERTIVRVIVDMALELPERSLFGLLHE